MALFNRKAENDPILTTNGKDTSDDAMQDIFDSFEKEEEYGNEPDFAAKFANIQPVYDTEDIDDEIAAINREINKLKGNEISEVESANLIATGEPYVEPEQETVEYEQQANYEEPIETITEEVYADPYLQYPEEDSRYESVLIPYDLLDPIDLNEGMSMDGIESLAESIADVGLLTDIIVIPNGDRFAIVSGERRYRAIGLNLEKGDTTYAQVPCKVSHLENIDIDIPAELKVKLILASANTEARKMTTSDQLLLQNYLMEVYEARKANGDVTGTKLEFVIEESGMSKSTIMTNQRIENKIIPELKEELLGDKDNEPSKNSLDRIAHYDEEKQQDLLNEIQEETPVEINKTYLDEFDKNYDQIIEEEVNEPEEEIVESEGTETETEIEEEKEIIHENDEQENNSEEVEPVSQLIAKGSDEPEAQDLQDEYENRQETLNFVLEVYEEFADAVQKGNTYILKENADQFDENINNLLILLNQIEDMLIFEDDIYASN